MNGRSRDPSKNYPRAWESYMQNVTPRRRASAPPAPPLIRHDHLTFRFMCGGGGAYPPDHSAGQILHPSSSPFAVYNIALLEGAVECSLHAERHDFKK
jgi:hypothetical protein